MCVHVSCTNILVHVRQNISCSVSEGRGGRDGSQQTAAVVSLRRDELEDKYLRLKDSHHVWPVTCIYTNKQTKYMYTNKQIVAYTQQTNKYTHKQINGCILRNKGCSPQKQKKNKLCVCVCVYDRERKVYACITLIREWALDLSMCVGLFLVYFQELKMTNRKQEEKMKR